MSDLAPGRRDDRAGLDRGSTSLGPEGLCSLLCVPLRVRERIIGVFNCYAGEPRTFPPQEIEVFQTLANQTALAIENARLVVNTALFSCLTKFAFRDTLSPVG